MRAAHGSSLAARESEAFGWDDRLKAWPQYSRGHFSGVKDYGGALPGYGAVLVTPTNKTLRLLEGTLHLGHGAKWHEKAMKAMAPNDPVTIGAKEPHFVHAASRVMLEVQSTGPFAITYVDPKDDPRTGSTP